MSISDEAVREIARAGDGSMRDAQSAFDQVISFAGKKIATADVEKALGLAGADVLARVMKGIAENHPAEALAIVDDIVMRGHNLRNFCREARPLLDLLVVKVQPIPGFRFTSRTPRPTPAEQFPIRSRAVLSFAAETKYFARRIEPAYRSKSGW